MEKNLINMARSGNKEAFMDLIDMYKRKMYVIAKSKVEKEEDVKDAIQETLLQVYTNIECIRITDSFNSWITRILLNNCTNILRTRGKTSCSYEELDYDKYFIDEDMFINIDSNISLFSLIECLNDDEKSMIVMYFSDGYTTKEISNILNINENTVRTKIKRGKEKIRNEFGKDF